MQYIEQPNFDQGFFFPFIVPGCHTFKNNSVLNKLGHSHSVSQTENPCSRYTYPKSSVAFTVVQLCICHPAYTLIIRAHGHLSMISVKASRNKM